jgi:hypothetical protein
VQGAGTTVDLQCQQPVAMEPAVATANNAMFGERDASMKVRHM